MEKEQKQKTTSNVKKQKTVKPAKTEEKLETVVLSVEPVEEKKPTTSKKTNKSTKEKEVIKVEKDVQENRILTKKEAEELGVLKKEKPEKKKKSKKEPVRFDVDFNTGLNDKQVQERFNTGYTNYVENKNTKTYKSIFLGNIFTFFNMLCFVVAGALISVGAWTNLVFMVVIIANMVIGIFQEIKAKKTIEKISLVTAPTAVVIRNGKQEEIPVSEIVLDDIIVFTLGKQISADCIVVDGEVEVNESLLTGESVAIKKVVGDTLLSGSFIVSGKCLAKADKVGSESYTAQLAVKAKQYKKAKSELLNSLNLIIKIIGIIIIPLAIFTFYNNYTQPGSNLTGTVTKTAG